MTAEPIASPKGKAHAVTGAFGFTGKYLAKRLLDAGERVITLTSSPDRANPFEGRVEARPFDFSDARKMAEQLKDVDVLYNTYWVRFNHDAFSHSSAVRNTLALFEAAKFAGVRRIVHVSITFADTQSPFEYFSAKGHLEEALKKMFSDDGRSYAIVRPAVLFGPEDILINNIAWALRRFPFFGLFGNGDYHIQPIYVDDMAALMQQEAKATESRTVNAVGPEDFTYRDLVQTIADAIGKPRRLVALSPRLAEYAVWLIGKLVGDVFITNEEIGALMANTLHAPGSEPTGTTRLSDWIREHQGTIGKRYHSELDRRLDRTKAY